MEMKSRLEIVEADIKETSRSIANIDVTLAKQHISLATHIKRTDLLEKLLLLAYTAVGGLTYLIIHYIKP